MGGLGSGRRYRKSEIKPILEDQITINIHDLNSENLLKPGNNFTNFYIKISPYLSEIFVEVEEDSLALKYCYKYDLHEQQIHIEKMPAYYGGARPYLICPDCGVKRVSLYLGLTTGQFGCRICHKFGYKSQRMNPLQRHSLKAEKYKKRLGQFSYPYDKPFRMWSRTFLKIQDKACKHEKTSCDLFLEYANQIFEKYGSKGL